MSVDSQVDAGDDGIVQHSFWEPIDVPSTRTPDIFDDQLEALEI